jgi:hypothetical protein
MNRILLVGTDKSLLLTRAAVLSTIGASVAHTTELSVPKGQPFDLLVLCHTLPRDTAFGLSLAARTWWPRVRILQIVHYEFETVNAMYANDVSTATPHELVRHVKRLLDETELESPPAPDHVDSPDACH